MKQLAFKTWGGKRRGAGRKNLSKTVNHMRREKVDFKRPLLITHRLKDGVPSLRRERALKVFQRAVKRARAFDVHVLHFALLGNHLHLIVEARDNRALGAGMRSLFGSMAKRLAKGGAFNGRYHLRSIATPTQMKHTLRYVLLNAVKHSDAPPLDPFSSGVYFREWDKLLGSLNPVRKRDLEPPAYFLAAPRSWLASRGWMRAA